jgi:hypothetical protein
MSAVDEELLSTLTPEEREAFEASEYDEQELDTIKKIAGEASDDDDADDEDDADEDAEPVEGKAAPKADDAEPPKAPASDPVDEPPDEPVAAQPVVPRYEAQLPQDYDQQIAALKARDAELRQRFKDGEIDIDERDAGLAELAEQRERLLVLRAKAEISQEMAQQTAAQQWQATINAFVAKAARDDGVDYRKDTALANDWDQFVRVLAAKPEHADKSMEWFLAEAHKRVMALHGMAKPAPKDPLSDAKAKRKPPVDAAPTTLAQVPGSDGPGDVGDEFADVMALDGWELEEAIAKMSPTQREKFLRGR